MNTTFYIAAFMALVATLLTITRSNGVHALLYLIVSLLAVAMVFFTLGAGFAAALEVIVYAGAIMVLFVFVVMMLNLGEKAAGREAQWIVPQIWIGPSILSAILALQLLLTLAHHTIWPLAQNPVPPQQVGNRAVRPLFALRRTRLDAAARRPGRRLSHRPWRAGDRVVMTGPSSTRWTLRSACSRSASPACWCGATCCSF